MLAASVRNAASPEPATTAAGGGGADDDLWHAPAAATAIDATSSGIERAMGHKLIRPPVTVNYPPSSGRHDLRRRARRDHLRRGHALPLVARERVEAPLEARPSRR